ncbi:MAG: PAS domain S-box protein [Chloroflexi bacterium]|nr:PAS domain S-box protein [Chloroflexota bacterium]
MSNRSWEINEELLWEILSQVGEGVFLTDSQGVCIDVNLHGCEMLGFLREELAGVSLFDLVLEGERDQVRVHVDQVLESGEAIIGATAFVKKNGEILEIEFNGSRLSNGRFLVVIRNISGRKLAEQSMRELADQWQATFDATNDAIMLLNKEQHILRSNRAMQELFGKTAAELTGKFCWQVVHNTDSSIVNCPTCRMIRTLRRESEEFERNGRMLEVTVDPVFGRDGVLLAAIHVIRDITEKRQMVQAVQESEEKYRQIFDLGADAIFLIDNETGQIQDVNRIASEMYGFTREELLLLRNVDLSAQPHETRKATQTGITNIPVRYHRKKDGTIFPVEITASHISYKGRPAHIAAIRDISERIKAEQALMESEAKFRSLVEQSPDGIIIVDEEGMVVEWNRGQELLSGLKREEVLGLPIWEIQYRLLPLEMRPVGFTERVKEYTRQTLETGLGGGLNLPRETAILRPDGSRCDAEVVMYTYKTDLGYRVGSIARDITERKQVEKRLEHMAMHDSLTGLPNRQLFQDRLSFAIERARREERSMLAVMLLDLDNFKEVNDTYGHAYGDHLLRLVAERLRNCLRKSDTAARMGGDEFTLINEDMSDSHACELVAQKVLSAISEPMQIEGHTFTISASIGISLYLTDSDDATTLLRKADIAMYQAKRTRNCYRFYDPVPPSS